MFFSCRGAKRGWAGVPASASLRAGAGGPVQADLTSMFFGVKLMFIGVMYFGQIQKIMFVVVNIFWSYSNNKVHRCEIFRSYSNQFSVLLIQSN